MKFLCPLCDSELRKRAMNYPKNIKLRTIESVHDRFVCSDCQATFDQEEVKRVEEDSDPEWLI